MKRDSIGVHFPIPQEVEDLEPIVNTYLTRNEREYLSDLSLKVFGTKSHWKKAMDKGVLQTMTEKLEDGTERKYKGLKYGTLEEVKKELEMLWDEKQKDEAKAKEVAEKVEENRKKD